MFGFGEKKKQDPHTNHTKKYGDVSLQKNSFSFSIILAWVEVN